MTEVATAFQMPVLVEVPVNHEAVKELPEPLRSRFEAKKSIEDIAADSERNTARSARLREAHIASVKERAARETQVNPAMPLRRARAKADVARSLGCGGGAARRAAMCCIWTPCLRIRSC
jgi:MoxR-like ATPase